MYSDSIFCQNPVDSFHFRTRALRRGVVDHDSRDESQPLCRASR
jgi:hypothetical protein